MGDRQEALGCPAALWKTTRLWHRSLSFIIALWKFTRLFHRLYFYQLSIFYCIKNKDAHEQKILMLILIKYVGIWRRHLVTLMSFHPGCSRALQNPLKIGTVFQQEAPTVKFTKKQFSSIKIYLALLCEWCLRFATKTFFKIECWSKCLTLWNWNLNTSEFQCENISWR